MVQLVDLSLVKEMLRVDFDDDDPVLTAQIQAVQEAVLRYLKVLDTHTWDAETVPAAVRQSIIIGVQSLYDPDSIELLGGLASSDPKNPIVAMLCMMRRPTLA